ncbi:hypothetical protein ACISK3_05725 [Morganella morganii]
MSSYAERIATAHIQCDTEEELLSLLKELTDKQMLGGWRLRKHETPPAGAPSPWYLLKDNARIALLPTHPFAAVSVADATIAEETEIKAQNDRIEHLSNAINSTYGILYCHLSFKALVI